MSRQRFVLLLVAALVVLSGALFFATQRNSTPETRGVEVFPALAGQLNAVSSVTLRKGSATPATTIRKMGDRWTVAERGDYPADVAKLRKLLSAVGAAKIIEEKTSDPARYPAIGVEDPTQPGATGAEISVTEPSGAHALIVGKSVGEGNFVRRAGEKRSYSVEPAISFETEPHFWIDTQLLDIPVAKIQSIEFKPAAGPGYAVHRVDADNAFSLDGAPAGRKPLDAHALAPAPTTFTALNADDVSPVAGIDFSSSSRTVVTQTDGDILTLTGTVNGSKHWLQVNSSKQSPGKTQGRAFEVASYRYDAIFKPLEQLLVPKETPPKAPPAAVSSHPPKKP